MANTLTIDQVSTVLNAIIAEATGKTSAIAVVDTSSFVMAGTTALKSGYDPLIAAIGTVLSKTIYKNRPYTRKFKGLESDEQRYGAATRKIYLADKPFVDDQRLPLADGASVDMQKVRKPIVLQMNFYGAKMYAPEELTIFKDQLDLAMSGPGEFNQFLNMLITNVSDRIEQAHETLARSTIANFISAKVNADNGVYHLLSEYNDATGQSLTATTLYDGDNFSNFTRWSHARIATISDLMTERTQLFHMNVAGKELNLHTPKANQAFYWYAPNRYQTESMVKSVTFNDKYLGTAYTETVNFWQNINDPMKISNTPIVMAADGALSTSTTTVTTDNVLGCLVDREAMGYTTVNTWQHSSPFNAAGGYKNMFWHFTDKHWNNFLENGVVFLLD